MRLDISSFSRVLFEWVVEHGVTITVILALAFFVRVGGRIFLERLIRRLVPSSHFRSKDAEQKREDTLIRIAHGTLNMLVWVVALLMILSEVGVNIGPLLAAAGVAGIAIGFGGQYLIRDVVAGIFIILENQYRVGDVVCLDATCGSVEDISIRMATLRDLDGTVHHIPHGVVTKVSNLSKDFARVNLDIGVAYSSDLEEVIRVINKTGEDMQTDDAWKDDIVKPVQFERVNDFADSAMMVKVLGETAPLRQWAVTGEYRKRIKVAFDKAGIEIPFPQRVVQQR